MTIWNRWRYFPVLVPQCALDHVFCPTFPNYFPAHLVACTLPPPILPILPCLGFTGGRTQWWPGLPAPRPPCCIILLRTTPYPGDCLCSPSTYPSPALLVCLLHCFPMTWFFLIPFNPKTQYICIHTYKNYFFPNLTDTFLPPCICLMLMYALTYLLIAYLQQTL